MQLIEELNKTTSSTPTLIQIGADAIWEDAWQIPFEKGKPSAEKISHYIKKKNTVNIAVEVLFETGLKNTIMWGVRYNDKLTKVTNVQDFLEKVFQCIWNKPSRTITSTIRDVSATLTGNSQELFSGEPATIELGVSNWWLTFKPLEIWNQNMGKNISRDELHKKISEHNGLLSNNKNYVGMELNYKRIPHHWLLIQVSEEREKGFELDMEKIGQLLSHYLEITLT